MADRKTRSARGAKGSVHPIGTPPGSSPNTGPLAAASWLIARDLVPQQPLKWFVTITLSARTGAKLDLEILSEEWGFRFEHEKRVSWIRVTDIAFAHGHDDHALLGRTPKLQNIGKLVRWIESTYGVRFEIDAPIVRTNLAEAERPIRDWLRSL